ncbi:MAG: class I SAM-dependent methyltransferase [Candidatus Latescibacterota bacterium]
MPPASEVPMPEWFEDDSFWETLYPYLFPTERFAAAAGEVDQLLALVRFQGHAVLDLCCGPGRHCVELARRGFQVTGVDRTPFLLDKARQRGHEAGVGVEWVQQDMRGFCRPEAFDLAISLFTSFGYFDDQRQDVAVLANLHASLRPGGALVVDVVGKEALARKFTPTASTPYPDGALLVQRHGIFDHWSRIRNEWILLRDGRAITFRFHHTIYSAQELVDRFAQVGFARVAVYGGLDGQEYGTESWRLVVVGWK